MDSQHRHELEQNDLAEALSGFGQWWTKWGNSVLVVVLIAAVSFTVYRYLNLRAVQAHETAWGDLAFESSPQGLQQIARTHSDPTVKAMAYLRAGDLQLAQALAPAPPEAETADTPDAPTGEAAGDEAPAAGDETSATPPPIDPQAALEDAASNYEQAAKLAPNATIKANALLGRAAVAESLREFDAAADRYREVIELAGESQAVIAALAKARLEALDELRTPVRFAPPALTPAPAPAPEATTPAAAPEATPPAEPTAAPEGATGNGPDAAVPAVEAESSQAPASPPAAESESGTDAEPTSP